MSGAQVPTRRPDRGSPRARRPGRPSARLRRVGSAVAVSLLAGLAVVAPSAHAAPTPMVDLGTAAPYAVLSGASVGNTVSAPGAPHTTLRGDLGVKANTQPTGFPPGVITGFKNVGNAAAGAAHDDLVAAYTAVAARTDGAPLAGALAGTTVGPGLHTVLGAVSNTTTVTLDAGGDPNAVFVFQVGGAMAMAAGSKVVLTGGAKASRVFWQVNGAGAVGANATFAGTLMALDAVAVGNGSVVNGRAFARNGALTLDANEVYASPPIVTIAGGADATTTSTTPTITGTTDVVGTDAVRVTVHGQTLKATPTAGGWTVTSALLANGTYPVAASVTDGAGNTTTAEQDLTVDTVLPVVALDGGATVLTDDSTPTISGTTDVTVGTSVQVRVAGRTLTAVVHDDGRWNVTPAALEDGTHPVVATVRDRAGNVGTSEQQLTVDTLAPVLTVVGGSTALGNDPTPTITGTAAVPAGTAVSVSLADEDLTASVDANGTWSATPAALADGPHRVVATTADPAGNATRTTQVLTIDTVAPLVTISGGTTATTTNHAPTITGTSDAAAGSTVTVTVSDQTMTTLVQGNGTWNATPTVVAPGTWTVAASVPDPAGNVGLALQTLTITTAPTGGGAGPGAGGDDTGGTGGTGGTGTGGTGTGGTGTGGTDAGAGAGTGAATGPGSTAGTGAPAPGLPGSATTPAPASVPLAQTPAGRATVARSTRQRVRGRSLSIGTRVRASASGRIRVTLRGSVRISGTTKRIALTTRTTSIAAGRTATPRIVVGGAKKSAAAAFRRIRTATRSNRRVTATITARIVDADGRARTVTRTVRLTK